MFTSFYFFTSFKILANLFFNNRFTSYFLSNIYILKKIKAFVFTNSRYLSNNIFGNDINNQIYLALLFYQDIIRIYVLLYL